MTENTESYLKDPDCWSIAQKNGILWFKDDDIIKGHHFDINISILDDVLPEAEKAYYEARTK